jgi:hypothetical protein
MTLVGTFLTIIGIIMIGMAMIVMNVWGPYLVEFKQFSDAFMAMIFF